LKEKHPCGVRISVNTECLIRKARPTATARTHSLDIGSHQDRGSIPQIRWRTHVGPRRLQTYEGSTCCAGADRADQRADFCQRGSGL